MKIVQNILDAEHVRYIKVGIMRYKVYGSGHRLYAGDIYISYDYKEPLEYNLELLKEDIRDLEEKQEGKIT